ncbi:CEX1 Citrate exporter 1 [Candida maltosa Xu316]|uniref:Putative MFS-MDR transporter n=1 Tax=Candida maltosa (strain Xu316) TaxID=1245528 RepID=M3K1Y5_CANMX|nr:putative MFS-MDR transporter [Candida maltosa Xu316]
MNSQEITANNKKTTVTFDEKQLPGTPPESITTLTDQNNGVEPKELADKLGDAHSNLLPTSQIIITLLTLSLANMVSFMDQTGITVGLSEIGRDLNAQQTINWAGSASLLANTVTQVLFGRMSDIFGRKVVIITCIMILVIGDIACSVARNGVEFFIFRALAGIGNGGVSSLSMVILSDIVSLKERGKYQGILGSSVGIGNAIGPFIMSGFIKQSSWRSYYYFLAPLGFVVNVILFFCLKSNKKLNDVISRKEKFKSIDYYGILAATASLTLLLVPLNGGGSTYRWDSNLVIILFTIGGVLMILFLGIEWKLAKLPMIPLRLFKSPSLCLLYTATFCFGAAYYSFTYYMPYFFQIIKGKDEIHTSIFVLPLVLMQAAGSFVCGQIISRTGHYFYVVQAGYILWLLGCCLLVLWKESLPDGVCILILLIMGMGVGASFQPSMVAIQANCKKSERAVAISTRNVLRSLGGSVGIAVGSTIVSNSVLNELNNLDKDTTSLTDSIVGYIQNHIYQKIDVHDLTAGQISEVRGIYTTALRNFFYFLIPLMAICVVTACFVKDNGLRALDETDEDLSKRKDLESSASSVTVR